MWRGYTDLDYDRYSFRPRRRNLQQFFPIFDKKRVFALQGRMITNRADDGQVVPFYLQPTLGGSDHAARLSDYRFRDDNLLVIQREYRWEAFRALDMALFTDCREGRSRTRPISTSANLNHAYGIGFRFNTYKTVFLRLDIAAGGREGLQSLLQVQQGVLIDAETAAHSSRRSRSAIAGALVLSPRPPRADRGHPRFYPRRSDLARSREHRTPRASSRSISASSTTSSRTRSSAPASALDRRAANVNTLDEVPDSSWFTNRIGRHGG